MFDGYALIQSAGRSPEPQEMPIEDAVDPVLPSDSHRSQAGNDPETAVGVQYNQSWQAPGPYELDS